MNRRKFTIALGTATAGLVTGSALLGKYDKDTRDKARDPGRDIKCATTCRDKQHKNAGKNSCKGKGGCHMGDNGCAGKNSCKGKGGCKVAARRK